MNRLYCVHGFLGSPNDWDRFELVKPHELTSITIPIRHSWSEGMRAIVDGLDPGAVICGYSMGARIALGCANQFQECFRGMVFISGNPGLISNNEREKRWVHDLGVIAKLQAVSIDEFLAEWYRQDVFADLSRDQIDQLVRLRRDVDVAYQVNLLSTYSLGHQPDFWPALKTLELPVLILTGSRDNKYCNIAKQMCNELSNAEHRVVADCGHNVPLERPDVFVNEVNRFLTEISKRSK